VFDVRRGIPYRELGAIYAEHFLEHLTLAEALAFLRESRRALAAGGKIRLSTPNLVWIWWTHDVRLLADAPPEARALRTLEANRAFYGWQHRFLWSRELLEEALAACGFESIRFHRYGESDDPALAGLEQHETFVDTPEVPHVLVAEASAGRFDGARFEAFYDQARRGFLDHLRG
jgi:hypothetical protein